MAKNFIYFLIIFALGSATGWWFTTQHYKNNHTNFVKPIAQSTPQIERPSSVPARASIWLTVEEGGQSRRVPALVLNGGSTIISALYHHYPVSAVHYIDPSSQLTLPLQVLAADEQSGLIAFALNQQQHPSLTVSEDDGSLYLGKELSLHLPNTRIRGQVDSALKQDSLEREGYAIKFDSAPSTSSGPIVDLSTNQLIGYIPLPGFGSTSARSFAVDAAQIRQLLSKTFGQALDIRDFTKQWSKSSGGLSLELRHLSSKDNWIEALSVAQQLWQLDQGETSNALLSRTALFAAQQLIEDNNPQDAISILSEMQQTFGSVQPWCALRAEASIIQYRWRAALDHIDACRTLDPASFHLMRIDSQSARNRAQTINQLTSADAYIQSAKVIALEAYRDQNVNIQEKQSLLSRANKLEKDPQVLRLLGDIEYDASRYANARAYYREATSLDPTMATLLANRLQNSDQRAQTTPATEVPFEERRGALVVTTFLNNSAQSFRFLVDTGATFSAVSTATLLRLGLSDVFANGAPLIELESAAGPIYVQRFTLDSMRIGSAQINHLPVVILEDLDGFDGLVGLSFLRHFDVTLDQQAGKLILTRR